MGTQNTLFCFVLWILILWYLPSNNNNAEPMLLLLASQLPHVQIGIFYLFFVPSLTWLQLTLHTLLFVFLVYRVTCKVIHKHWNNFLISDTYLYYMSNNPSEMVIFWSFVFSGLLLLLLSLVLLYFNLIISFSLFLYGTYIMICLFELWEDVTEEVKLAF